MCFSMGMKPLAAALLVGVGSVAHGSEPSVQEQPASKNEAPEVTKTSADFRKDATMDFAVEVGTAVLPAVGLTVGGYLSDRELIELNAAYGDFNAVVLRIQSQLVELRYKRFWGNSFYTNLGAGLRNLRVSSPLVEVLSGGDSFAADSSSAVVGFAIGNRWQWEHFLIGCDWV